MAEQGATDLRDLKRVLQKITAARASGGAVRTLRADAPGGLLARVLDLLGGIVLPRKVVLERLDRQVLELTVANRCLYAIRAPRSGAALATSGDDEKELATAKAHLDRFLNRQTQIGARIEKPSDTGFARSGGASVASLAAAWGLTEAAPDAGDRDDATKAFLSEHRASIPAWSHVSGGPVEYGGDAAQFETLDAMRQSARQILSDYVQETTEEAVLLLGPEANGAEAFVYAETPASQVAFALTPSDLAAVTTLRQACR